MLKEGESFAMPAVKKPECIVTGGLHDGRRFQGTTYYVCCSGCREAFYGRSAKYTKVQREEKEVGEVPPSWLAACEEKACGGRGIGNHKVRGLRSAWPGR